MWKAPKSRNPFIYSCWRVAGVVPYGEAAQTNNSSRISKALATYQKNKNKNQFSSDSIACLNTAYGCAPTTDNPLIKKLGVPPNPAELAS